MSSQAFDLLPAEKQQRVGFAAVRDPRTLRSFNRLQPTPGFNDIYVIPGTSLTCLKHLCDFGRLYEWFLIVSEMDRI